MAILAYLRTWHIERWSLNLEINVMKDYVRCQKVFIQDKWLLNIAIEKLENRMAKGDR